MQMRHRRGFSLHTEETHTFHGARAEREQHTQQHTVESAHAAQLLSGISHHGLSGISYVCVGFISLCVAR